MALHFNCSPLELDEEQVLDYLHYLKTLSKTPSSSYFKHTVYGLSFAYKVMGIASKGISLPSLKFPKKLPVVLSKQEIRWLFKTPQLLKHRIVLAMLYGCGLRRFELLNIKLQDVDLDRKMLHVREGKGRKDRYVPIGEHLSRGLKTYLDAEPPYVWLFNGKNNTGQLLDDGLYKNLFMQNWVVYCKRPFWGPSQVVEYLGRYTHKIAISNHRIKNIENGNVTFSAKDYRQGGKIHPVSFTEKEFIRRFAMHILGHIKIRVDL